MTDDIKIKRKRGRPRVLKDNLNHLTRTRGRPRGSKNKPKDQLSIDLSNGVINSSIDSYNDQHNINNNLNKSLDNKKDNQFNALEGGIGTMDGQGRECASNTPQIHTKNQKSNISNNPEQSNQPLNPKQPTKITTQHVIAARRELALQSIVDYACMIDIPDTPINEDDEDAFTTIKLNSLAAHHALICNTFQELVTTKANQRTYDHVMIFMPPGSAKSTYLDVVCASWFMAKFKRKQVILASYGDEPALAQARKTKALVNSKDYQNLFPDVKLSKDRTAVDNWALSNGSSFLSRSLGGEITGRRSDLGLVDDPVKGAEDADSETMQMKTWNNFIKNFCTRLKPGAPIFLIMTRWNENDLAGKILPDGWDGESGDFLGKDDRRWRVICVPAICDREDDPLGRGIGDSLWPEWFGSATGDPMDHWKPFRKETRTWMSLYQQKPTAGDGIYFIRENIIRYNIDKLPQINRYYGTSDYAVSEQTDLKPEDRDYTVLRIWGIDDNVDPPDIYLIDGWRGRTKSDKWIKEQCKLMHKYKPFKWFGEAGVIQKAIEPMLREAMRNYKPERIVCNLEWLPSTVSKEIRARGAQSLTEEQRIKIPDTAEYDAVLNEYVKFPTGKHDDDVDNLSLIGRVIDMITIKRRKSKVIPIPTTKTAFNRKNPQ